jgi:hypothetical protein
MYNHLLLQISTDNILTLWKMEIGNDSPVWEGESQLIDKIST